MRLIESNQANIFYVRNKWWITLLLRLSLRQSTDFPYMRMINLLHPDNSYFLYVGREKKDTCAIFYHLWRMVIHSLFFKHLRYDTAEPKKKFSFALLVFNLKTAGCKRLKWVFFFHCSTPYRVNWSNTTSVSGGPMVCRCIKKQIHTHDIDRMMMGAVHQIGLPIFHSFSDRKK